MSNTDVFLKYNARSPKEDRLEYSFKQTGPFSPLADNTLVAEVWNDDTITFIAIPDGDIQKLIKIDDGQNGVKLISTQKNKDDKSIIVTIINHCQENQVDKFGIKYKPEGAPATEKDPEIKTKQPQ